MEPHPHMPNPPLTRNSVRVQCIILAAFLALLGALMGLMILIDQQRTRTNEATRLATQAMLVSNNLQQNMHSANHILEETLALYDIASDEQQLERMHTLANAMPIIRAIGILDSNGIQKLTTRPALDKIDFSDRPYFISTKADPQRQRLYISTPYMGITGKVSITLSKAILDEDNRYQGAVFAVLEADYIEMLMRSTLYTTDMWATLLHVESGEAVRVEAGAEGIGKEDLSRGALEGALPRLTRTSGPTYIHDEDGDDTHLVTATTISGYAGNAERPLVVVTGRNYEEAMEAWRRRAYMQLGLFLLFAVAAVGGLLFYQRRRRQYDARRASDQLRVQAREQDYRIIVERTADCVVKLDPQGNCSYANPAFCRLFSLSLRQAQGLSFLEHIEAEDQPNAINNLEAALRHSSEQRFEARCSTPAGPRHMEWTLCSVLSDEGRRASVIGVGRDVSAHIAMRDELRSLAHHDSLTGLTNRGRFQELAATEIGRSHRYGLTLALLLIDLDHFKRVNDTLGHHAGDVALQTCARVLQSECRESDVAARVGGEEFAVLLPNTPIEEALQVAERLRAAIAAQAVVLQDGSRFNLTASLGVAGLHSDESLEALMQRADRALYGAKQSGRDRVEVSDA